MGYYDIRQALLFLAANGKRLAATTYTNISFSLETHYCRRHTCTCATKFLHYLGTGCCLSKTTFRTKIGGGWTRGASKKIGTPYVFLQPLKLVTSNLVHNLGLGLPYQKQRFGPNLAGVWARGASPKNLGTPCVFLQPLKLATSNLVHTLGLGLAYQKTTFWTKIGGVWVRGASQKNWDPLRISATVEASNFKFGTQLGYGTSLPKNNV